MPIQARRGCPHHPLTRAVRITQPSPPSAASGHERIALQLHVLDDGGDRRQTNEVVRLWEWWRGGESIRAMVRALGVSMPRIRRFLCQSGGVRPGTSVVGRGHLAAGEREEISRGIAAGLAGRAIADRLAARRRRGRARSPATVAATPIVPWSLMPPLTSGPGVRNRASWRPTPCCVSLADEGSCRTVRRKPSTGVATPSCVGPSRYAFRLMAGSDGARHHGNCARVGIECRR